MNITITTIDAKCENYYNETGNQDRYIVVDEKNVLVDGYIMYLVLKSHDVEYCDAKRLTLRKHKYTNRQREKYGRIIPPEKVLTYKEKSTVYIYGNETDENCDHIFISSNEVEKYRNDMIAYTERVNYCSFATKQQILDNDFYIINPTGYYELKLKTKGMDVHLVTIMVNVPFSELRKRAKKRGDFSTWEANYKKESEEFTIFEKSNLIDYFVLNDGNIEESIKKMENIIKKDKSKRGVTTDEN